MTDRWTTYLARFHRAHSNIKLQEKGRGENHPTCTTHIGSDDLIDLIKDDETIHVEKLEKLKIIKDENTYRFSMDNKSYMCIHLQGGGVKDRSIS